MISSNSIRKRKGLSQPTKKLTIKLSKSKPTVPAHFEENMWKKLQEATIAIQNKAPVAHSREELYSAVENLCIHKKSAALFEKLQREIDQHVGNKVDSLLNQTPDHVAFLEIVVGLWQDYCDQMLTIRSIFLYLDRTYIINNSPVRSFWDMGLSLLQQHFASHVELEEKIVKGLLNQVELERNGESVNQAVVRGVVRMLTSIKTYHMKFEPVFLSATSSFYNSESNLNILEMQIPDYLKHVEKRLQEEFVRVSTYLDPSSRNQLIHATEKELLLAHSSAILEKGFDDLMDNNRIEDLARLYTLFNRVSCLAELKKSLSTYVKRVGIKIVQDVDNDKEMVPILLAFKEKMDKILTEAMQSNSDFEKALKDAFEIFINSRQNKPAELIAKYIDARLKTGNKGGTEEEIETLLDNLMVLFRFINGKDVFEAFYKKDLSKRLLLKKSASYDLERTMISKLKSECGASFTSKLEGMFKDIDLSRDLMDKFEQHQQSSGVSSSRKVSMFVHVLTTGCWPAAPTYKINLPPLLAENQQQFTEFYKKKHQGRRLNWQYSLCSCILRFTMDSGRKELSVSLMQALVLLLFNQGNELEYTSIKESIGLDDEGELKRTLQSLACGKVRVLSKVPKGRDISNTDKFTLVTNLKHKAFRIKINSIQLKETPKENKETHARIKQDRQYQIDAALVRIMKARKKMTHPLLVAELFKQLQFPAKPQDLKRRIESLIDREYLERSEDEPNTYLYLA